MNTDDVAQVSVAGRTQRACTVRKVARLCDAHLGGYFDLKIVDVCVQPERAERRCVAAPGLIRVPPPPARCVAGIWLDSIRVLAGLRLAAE